MTNCRRYHFAHHTPRAIGDKNWFHIIFYSEPKVAILIVSAFAQRFHTYGVCSLYEAPQIFDNAENEFIDLPEKKVYEIDNGRPIVTGKLLKLQL